MYEWLLSLTDWGTQVILWVQGFRSAFLDGLFAGASMLGTPDAYLVLLPLIYWSVDRAAGVGLSYVILLSAWLNGALKAMFAIPRPSDPRIVRLDTVTDTTFPSGHAQNGVVTWGYLAAWVRKPIAWVLAVVLILLIGASRVYLGVHYPQDVLAGYVLGALFLAGFFLVQKPISRLVARLPFAGQVVLAILSAALLLLLSPAAFLQSDDGMGPAVYAGAILGLNLGVLLERRYVRFSSAGGWAARAGRFVAGLILVAICYLGPRQVLAALAPAVVHLPAVRFLRYLLVGLAVSWLAPWGFVAVGLAEREK